MNAMEMIVIFFAIILGAVITLIIVSAYREKGNSRKYVETRSEEREQPRFYASAESSTPRSPSTKPRTKKTAPSSSASTSKKSTYLPYKKKYLLTQHEYRFYQQKLKPLADKYGLQILAKIRFADLVEVDEEKVKEEYFDTWFHKIMAKHVDFAFSDNMRIVTIVELDDRTHSEPDRIERDEFVNAVLKKCGYTIIHSYGETAQIEKELQKYRKSTINAVG